MLDPSTSTPLMKLIRLRRSNAADWHGLQAVKAYRRKDLDAYVRHVRIADKLWGRKR